MIKQCQFIFLLLASGSALLPLSATAQESTKMHRSDISELSTPSPTHPDTLRNPLTIGSKPAVAGARKVTAHSDADSRAMGNGHGHPMATNSAGSAPAPDRGSLASHDRRWSHAFDTGHDAPTSARVEFVSGKGEKVPHEKVAHRKDVTILLVHQEDTSFMEGDPEAEIYRETDEGVKTYMHTLAPKPLRSVKQ